MPTEAEVLHSVYLIGDAGEEEGNPMYEVVSRMIRAGNDTATTVVWLGDNIYYDGLPKPDESDREEKEKVILREMQVTDTTFEGRTIFIPGNHDWNESHSGGLAAVRRQEDFIESYFKKNDIFIPNNGCAGPEIIDVNDRLVIIAVDTEWWSHKYLKPRYPDDGCVVEDRIDLIVQLEDAIRSNEDKNILIVAHHPIMSNSNHGGHFNFLDHIFPLRLVRDHLYIPLPVIGSAYPLLRKLGVSAQDIPSPELQQWKSAIFSMAEHRPNVIYAAGHDHNIQLHKHEQMHHIVSGSGSKTNFAARGFGAAYVHQRIGFARLLYYNDGQVWIEYFVADDEYPEGELTLRTPLYSYAPATDANYEFENVPDYTDSVKTIAANEAYNVSKFARLFVGEHYRKEWTTPVEVPYIDLKTFSGGLKPVKKGGGRQTLSLRLINDDSVQFALRSINKFPEKAIPVQFRNTWVSDFVKDQISTAHPYGAFTIPIMADAIDIYYTRPKLVYTPYTPYLRQYINQFGGMMSMIEVRPDEDLSTYDRFGNSENIVSSETMFRHLRESNNNQVDQRLYLKSRLFDMIVGDWDRHEDQWRWAEYKSDTGSYFKPIPLDRDQVYSKFDGIIPWLLTRQWAFRYLVSFEEDFDDIKGLNKVAQNTDRMLLNKLNREDWEEIATNLKYQLSDLAIEKAVRQMPEEVFTYSGEEIIRKLKSRRDQIIEAALFYYDFLSEEVYLVTSNENERFEITHYRNDSTSLRVFQINETGDVKKLLYSRQFYDGKTDEIRIFGRDGNDQFVIKGPVKDPVKVKIVGGEGSDKYWVDLDAHGKRVWIYDNEIGNDFQVSEATKLILSDEVWVNKFDRDLYQYDYAGPSFEMEHNIDDGLLLGVGAKFTTNGFRSEPHKAEYFISGYHAFATNAWNFIAEAQWYNTFGHTWDLHLSGEFLGPDYVFNYFGYGNNSSFDKANGIDFYRLRKNVVRIEPSVVHRFSPVWSLGAGPTYAYYNVEDDSEGVLSTLPATTFNSTAERHFAGAKFFSEVNLRDKSVDPEKGLNWLNEVSYHNELSEGAAEFTSLSSDLSFYFTPNFPFRATFAFRVGGGMNFGDFYFYQSQFLDGTDNIRGYRRTRFAGRSMFFTNMELRLKLIQIRTNLLSGDIGAIGFFDIGKVWTDQLAGDGEWKNGTGPGLYINFYDSLILSSTYAISDEHRIFYFRLGFLF